MSTSEAFANLLSKQVILISQRFPELVPRVEELNVRNDCKVGGGTGG